MTPSLTTFVACCFQSSDNYFWQCRSDVKPARYKRSIISAVGHPLVGTDLPQNPPVSSVESGLVPPRTRGLKQAIRPTCWWTFYFVCRPAVSIPELLQPSHRPFVPRAIWHSLSHFNELICLGTYVFNYIIWERHALGLISC